MNFQEPPMPEHDKFRPHKDDAQTIGEFIEWLQSENIRFMKWGNEYWEEKCPKANPVFENEICVTGQLYKYSYYAGTKVGDPIGKCPDCDDEGYRKTKHETWISDGRNIQQLIADFFGIDKKKFDEETEALYQAVSRKANDP